MVGVCPFVSHTVRVNHFARMSGKFYWFLDGCPSRGPWRLSVKFPRRLSVKGPWQLSVNGPWRLFVKGQEWLNRDLWCTSITNTRVRPRSTVRSTRHVLTVEQNTRRPDVSLITHAAYKAAELSAYFFGSRSRNVTADNMNMWYLALATRCFCFFMARGKIHYYTHIHLL